MSTATTDPPARPRPDGPPLAPVVAVFVVLFVAGLVFPAPGDRTATGGVATVAVATLQVGAAFPLAVFAAAVQARLNRLGVRVAGATIAFTGGAGAAASLAGCGAVTWVRARQEVGAAGTGGDGGALDAALADLAFATGGPVHVGALGLLVAGIAVPALLLGLLPRWLAVAGWVLALGCEVSVLALAVPALTYLLPVRFLVLAWLFVVAVRLPRRRLARSGREGG